MEIVVGGVAKKTAYPDIFSPARAAGQTHAKNQPSPIAESKIDFNFAGIAYPFKFIVILRT